MNRHLHGNQCQGRKIWTVIDELMMEAQCGQVWDLKTTEGTSDGAGRDGGSNCSHFCEFHLTGPHSQYWRKIPSTFQQGKKEKKPFWNMLEDSVFSKTTPPHLHPHPQEKLFYQNLTCWGFIRAWPTWGKGNTQLQPHLTILYHLSRGWGGILRSTGELHSPGTQTHEKRET